MPNGIPDIWYALLKDIVTTPADAVDYARVILRREPALSATADVDLAATERDKVWHVVVFGRPGDIVRISREDRRVAFGVAP